MIHIVTWMYSSPAGEHILHNQIGASVSSQRAQDYYWRCVFCLFESSHRLNEEVRHILFVNKRPPERIDGFSTQALLERYRIEVVEFPHMTLSPPDYWGAWNTQFMVLDILEWLPASVRPEDAVMILDSDIVFNKPLPADFAQTLAKRRALVYSIDVPSQNGLTNTEMLSISREINPLFPRDDFVYSGGEFVCLSGSQVRTVSDMARATYEECLRRHALGKIKFNEEAHLLSFVYQSLGYENYSAEGFIKRIWTDRSVFSNVDGTEQQLLMWHLPAEKKHGFVKVFGMLGHNGTLPQEQVSQLPTVYRLIESPAEFLKRCLRTVARPPARLLKRLRSRLT